MSTCVKLIEKALSEGTYNDNACRLLSSLATASKAAASHICSMVNRIFEKEDEDGVDESHAKQVIYSLRVMCSLPPGAAAACKAGIINEAETTLVNAKSRDLRAAALNLLRQVASASEAARTAMRDSPVIEKAVEYINEGIANSTDKAVGQAALGLLLVLSESESLRAAIRNASPLESLESLCNTSSAERTDALLLVANVYSSVLDLASSKAAASDVEATSQRVSGLLIKYRIEQEVTTALGSCLRALNKDPVGNVRSLRRGLAAVRSLATSAQLAPRLVQAGVAATLVRTVSEVETHPLGATAADLAIAAEAIQRLAFVPELRPQLKERALEALQGKLGGSDQSEGGQRLQQAVQEAVATLNGDRDINITDKHKGSSEGSADVENAPRYNVFISHKRSDAQDFARGL